MPYFCTGGAETWPDCKRVTETPTLAQNKRSVLMTMAKNDSLEVVRPYLESPFYKDAACLCKIVKDVSYYALKTPCGVILPLMSQLFLIVARPLDFRFFFLNVLLSAVMPCFICCVHYCMQ